MSALLKASKALAISSGSSNSLATLFLIHQKISSGSLSELFIASFAARALFVSKIFSSLSLKIIFYLIPKNDFIALINEVM